MTRAVDIVIEGGTVIDGTGGSPFRADVGIVGQRIVAVADLTETSRRRTIDASGRIVAPGFIDLHSHSDLALLIDQRASSKLLQGVTTEIVGNCGMSAAPFVPDSWILGLSTSATAALSELEPWSDMASYLGRVETASPAVNVGVLIGFGTVLRSLATVGDGSAMELADSDEVVAALEDAFAVGAFGVSLGLYYEPDHSASQDMVSAVFKTASARQRLVAAHIRDESDFEVGLRHAASEVVDLAKVYDARLQVSHLKAIGPGGWAQLGDAVETIGGAVREGYDVGADQYPYVATETALVSAMNLAPDGAAKGSCDPEMTQAVIRRRGGPQRIVIGHCDARPDLVGLSLEEVSARLEMPPVDAVNVLATDAETTVISFALRDEDVTQIMTLPWVSIASDGVALTERFGQILGRQHPRSYGTFPRVLGRYVRHQGVLSLPAAVHKMTGAPAARLGLSDRGTIANDNHADLVVFDPDTIIDTADFDHPDYPPTGVETVLVNGTVAVALGRQTSEHAGEVLRA